MSYQDQIQAKRDNATKSATLQRDIKEANKEVVQAFKQVMDVLKQPAVIKTDDLDEQVKELSKTLKDTLTNLESKTNEDVVELTKNYEQTLRKVLSLTHKQNDELQAILSAFVKATEAITVDVPAPVVNVEEKAVDFSPLLEYLSDDKINLNDFKASDLDDQKEVQYVGFIHPNGSWYIIENANDQLRYIFGADKYPSSWQKRAQYQYKRLNEAYRAISS